MQKSEILYSITETEFSIAYQMVEKYVKDARVLIAMQEESEIMAAVDLLDAALALSPRCEQALELKARSLLYLRRFKEVADMLQDYIPSVRMASDDSESSSSDSSSQQLSCREQASLLDSSIEDQSFRCFSISELKKTVMTGLWRSSGGEEQGKWR